MPTWSKGSGIPAGGPGKGRARGYSWEQFGPGNEARTTHGASRGKSGRYLAPIAESLIAQLSELAPWTSYPAFRPSVEAWAWAEARCVRFRAWADEHDVVAKGKALPYVAEWERAETRAESLRSQLGLDPSSLSKILSRASSRMSKAVGGGDAGLLEALEAAGAAMIAAEVEERRGAMRPQEALEGGLGES